MPPSTFKQIYINENMQLVTEAIDRLFEPEQKRLKGITEQLVHKNFLLGGNSNGFFYKTKLYASLKPFQLRQENITILHPTLEFEAEHLHNLTIKLDKDRTKLRQLLSAIISNCDTKICHRNVLPEAIVQSIPVFRGLKRTAEPKEILEDPDRYQQYVAACEIVDYYVANQVIYS